MNAMKDDFLTIPIAPNYEVNSELVVRNKKTGHILKEYRKHVVVWSGKRQFHCTAKLLRRLALSAVEYKGTELSPRWVAVPSLNYRYELSCTGILRNAKTKRRLKMQIQQNHLRYRVPVDGRVASISLKSLMWEVFGVMPKISNREPVPTTICKGDKVLHFDSLMATAKFMVKVGRWALKSILGLLYNKRPNEIDGWAITYHEPITA